MTATATTHDGLATLDAALALHDAGCSVVRVTPDGSKRPMGGWKAYTETRADRDTVTAWFAGGHPGVGVVTGAVSGNLELLELEGRAVHTGLHTELAQLAADSGLGDLWNRILGGYCETSPAGGLHFLYRVDGTIPGNTKLAREADGKLPLIETRGEGGFVVVAPSSGPVHPTGKPWTLLTGGPATIPTLTVDEHEQLHILARCLDRAPQPQPAPETAFAAPGNTPAAGTSPGDDYNSRATWDQLLGGHGWRRAFTRGNTTHWTRPGKNTGTSATTGYGDRGDWLYVFTTGTELPTEQALSKFAVYAHLEHRGDFRAAAAALKTAGYGTPPAERNLRIVAADAADTTDTTDTGPARHIRPTLASRLIDRGGLNNLPRPEPLIDDTIDRRTVSLLAGYWGTGKSFIAQDWAACVATGKPWQGRPVATGRVLYIAAEGAYGLSGRLDAWEYAWRHKIPHTVYNVLPMPVNLLDRVSVAELCDIAAGHTLVVVDTLARCLVGADENSAKDMGSAVDALYTIREATGDGTVLAVHHTGKDRTTVRGSSALEAGVDTIYTTEGDARLIKLERTKRKDGPLDDILQLQLQPTAESVVVVNTSGADLRDRENRLLDVFRLNFAATGASKSDLRAVADMPPATFHRALNDLLARGLVRNTGTDHRPFYVKGGEPS